MTLTIIFIHEDEVMTLIAGYSPELDHADTEGVWDVDNNRVAMSWRLFKEFHDEKDNSRRAKMMESFRKISKIELGAG